MKKIILVFLTLILGAFMVGCGSSSSYYEDEEIESVTTIMYYEVGDAAGSGDLSQDIKDNIKMFGTLETEEVNVVCQFKLNDSEDVRRGIAAEDGDNWEDYSVINTGKMSDGDTLRDFIEYAKIACPAQKYVLVIGGHGNGYDTSETKGSVLLNDDSFLTNGTIGEVCKSYNIDACLFDTCFMACFENLCCCYDAFKYIVVTERSMNAYSMYNLVTQLVLFVDLETALGTFTKKQADIYGNTCDVKLIETAMFPQVISSFKNISDYLYKNMKNYSDEIKTARSNIKPMYDNYDLYDFENFYTNLQSLINDSNFDKLIDDYKLAAGECFVYNHRVTEDEKYGPGNGFSLSIPDKKTYDSEYKTNYPQTIFAQATGWDRILANQEN